MNVWERVKGLIYSGAYVLSFLLPSVSVQSSVTGFGAFMVSIQSLMPPYFFLAVGNIFMLMAIFSLIFPTQKEFIKWGLTAQSLLLILTTVCTLFSGHSGSNNFFLIGYYVWMGSQVAMCFLIWEKDEKIDDIENSKNFILVLACSLSIVFLAFILINLINHKIEDNQKVITQQNNQLIKNTIQEEATQFTQCEDNAKKKLNTSSVTEFQSALTNIKWTAQTVLSNKTIYYLINFYSDGTYLATDMYKRHEPYSYHGHWQVVGIGHVKLINNDDSQETNLNFDLSTGGFKGYLAEDINIQGNIECKW